MLVGFPVRESSAILTNQDPYFYYVFLLSIDFAYMPKCDIDSPKNLSFCLIISYQFHCTANVKVSRDANIERRLVYFERCCLIVVSVVFPIPQFNSPVSNLVLRYHELFLGTAAVL